MKANERREMQTAELTSKLADLKAELFKLRSQHAINQLEKPGRIEAVKKLSLIHISCYGLDP